MTTTLRTAYATKHTPDIADAARALFGDDVSIAGTPNADPTGPLATWPYPAEAFEVVGRAAAHRSGPLFTVVKRAAPNADLPRLLGEYRAAAARAESPDSTSADHAAWLAAQKAFYAAGGRDPANGWPR